MSSTSHTDESRLDSDDVQVDLTKGQVDHDEVDNVDKREGKQSLLSDVDPARQITITWKDVNVFVPVFNAKKSVLKDPKQLLGPLSSTHRKPEKRQVRPAILSDLSLVITVLPIFRLCAVCAMTGWRRKGLAVQVPSTRLSSREVQVVVLIRTAGESAVTPPQAPGGCFAFEYICCTCKRATLKAPHLDASS